MIKKRARIQIEKGRSAKLGNKILSRRTGETEDSSNDFRRYIKGSMWDIGYEKYTALLPSTAFKQPKLFQSRMCEDEQKDRQIQFQVIYDPRTPEQKHVSKLIQKIRFVKNKELDMKRRNVKSVSPTRAHRNYNYYNPQKSNLPVNLKEYSPIQMKQTKTFYPNDHVVKAFSQLQNLISHSNFSGAKSTNISSRNVDGSKRGASVDPNRRYNKHRDIERNTKGSFHSITPHSELNYNSPMKFVQPQFPGNSKISIIRKLGETQFQKISPHDTASPVKVVGPPSAQKPPNYGGRPSRSMITSKCPSYYTYTPEGTIKTPEKGIFPNVLKSTWKEYQTPEQQLGNKSFTSQSFSKNTSYQSYVQGQSQMKTPNYSLLSTISRSKSTGKPPAPQKMNPGGDSVLIWNKKKNELMLSSSSKKNISSTPLKEKAVVFLEKQLKELPIFEDHNFRKLNELGVDLFYQSQYVDLLLQFNFKKDLNGVPICIMSNGDIYKGDLRNDKKEGTGVCKYVDGSIYFGEWRDDLRHGACSYLTKEGYIILGRFDSDNFVGSFAQIKYLNGELYEGQITQFHRRHGQGKHYYISGDAYEGAFHNNKREGKGKIYFKRRGVFDGTFKDDQIVNGIFTDEDQNVFTPIKPPVDEFPTSKFPSQPRTIASSIREQTTSHFKLSIPEIKKVEGTFKGGYLNGETEVKYRNGDSYKGNFRNGKRKGYGIMVYSTRNDFDMMENVKYSGFWHNNKREGDGLIEFADGSQFLGKWKNNQRVNGKLLMNNGMKYEGPWENDFPEGIGKLSFEDGRIYKGNFHKGACPNYGKIIYPEGNVYKGELYMFQIEGKGKMKYANGDVYTGSFSYNQRDGEGEMIYSNGDRYSGSFISDKRSGEGKCFYSKLGEIYEGEWHNDVRSGHGRLLKENGTIIEGYFSNDVFQQ